VRHVPPTVFPTAASALLGATVARGAALDPVQVRASAERALTAHFARTVLALLDSGTSALTLAIRLAAEHLGRPVEELVVAVPAYGCIDVPTAVMGAGARAIGYDLDPATLAPDEASLQAALSAGASLAIVSHLFGHPVALAPWRAACERHGALLVEDAAQWAGARLHDRPLGQEGHFVILSLGRGKGLVGTGGGALLGGETLDLACPAAPSLDASGRLGTLVRGAAALLLGRPALYGIPASIPALRLGEMVFHPPRPATAMSLVSARLLPGALARAESERALRERVALRYLAAAASRGATTAPIVPAAAAPGVLRQAFLLARAAGALPRALGVVRPYPRPLWEQLEVASIVQRPVPMPGAAALASRLVTLPVHAQVGDRDVTRLCDWLSVDPA
jgi:dTDP-4-amino-4,6-dideoxygalactose transaminase